ncbi:ABC transporter ATP-binding protein [Candidatus Woesearchaeota archaeon]|nr:ABC transporter ATP-binding protein [Candidatus Woesearchaeota archaeon]
MPKKVIIELNKVWKIYRRGQVEIPALGGVDLQVNEGTFLAIAGASGSGKSTMMNLVGCLDLPSKGQVFLDGIDISTLKESELARIRGRKIGFIFQQFNLIPTLTALENVMLPLEFQGADTSFAKKKALEFLGFVGLKERTDHLPSQLSGGQMQRVAIARALVMDPEVILADEPTGNLDSKTGDFIMNFLSEIHKRGKTIILVTHDLKLLKHAECVVYMKDGLIDEKTHNHSKHEAHLKPRGA